MTNCVLLTPADEDVPSTHSHEEPSSYERQLQEEIFSSIDLQGVHDVYQNLSKVMSLAKDVETIASAIRMNEQTVQMILNSLELKQLVHHSVDPQTKKKKYKIGRALDCLNQLLIIQYVQMHLGHLEMIMLEEIMVRDSLKWTDLQKLGLEYLENNEDELLLLDQSNEDDFFNKPFFTQTSSSTLAQSRKSACAHQILVAFQHLWTFHLIRKIDSTTSSTPDVPMTTDLTLNRQVKLKQHLANPHRPRRHSELVDMAPDYTSSAPSQRSKRSTSDTVHDSLYTMNYIGCYAFILFEKMLHHVSLHIHSQCSRLLRPLLFQFASLDAALHATILVDSLLDHPLFADFSKRSLFQSLSLLESSHLISYASDRSSFSLNLSFLIESLQDEVIIDHLVSHFGSPLAGALFRHLRVVDHASLKQIEEACFVNLHDHPIFADFLSPSSSHHFLSKFSLSSSSSSSSSSSLSPSLFHLVPRRQLLSRLLDHAHAHVIALRKQLASHSIPSTDPFSYFHSEYEALHQSLKSLFEHILIFKLPNL